MKHPLSPIEKLLLEQGLSATAVCKKAGVSKNTITYMLKNPNLPRLKTITKLAVALDVPPLELFEDLYNYSISPDNLALN